MPEAAETKESENSGLEAIDPTDVPWKTAPEYVDQALADLDIDPDSEAAEYALELAHQYGLEHSTDHAPRSIAAGVLYLGMLIHPTSVDRPVSQPPLADSLNVTPRTVSRAYREMAVEEGYNIASQDGEDDPVPEDLRGLLSRIRRWVRA